jgi:hypothetical protein
MKVMNAPSDKVHNLVILGLPFPLGSLGNLCPFDVVLLSFTRYNIRKIIVPFDPQG